MKEMKKEVKYIDQNLEVVMAYLPYVQDAIENFSIQISKAISNLSDILSVVQTTANDITDIMENAEKEHKKFLDTRNKEIADKIYAFETTVKTATTDIQNVNIELRKNTDSIKTLSNALISFTNTLTDTEKKMKQNIQNTLQQERENMKKVFYLTIATNITTICLALFLAYEVLKKT